MIIPSKYQKEVYDQLIYTQKNIIINAVAGSGKSTTLLECANVTRSFYSRILFLAFTKKIVGDMAVKAEEQMVSNVMIKTVHAFGYREIANHIAVFDKKPVLANFKYYDLAKKLVSNKKRLSENEKKTANLAARLIEDGRLRLFTSSEQYRQFALDKGEIDDVGILNMAVEMIPDLETIGLEEVDNTGKISFSDMIFFPYKLGLVSEKFDMVLLDECQDFSPLQLAVIKRYCKDARVVAAGDPRQSIYLFAGASSDSYSKVREAFRAVELPLSVCYRCSKNFVELAKKYVPQIEPHKESENGTLACVSIEDVVTMAKDNDLVLSRTNAPLVKLFFMMISKMKKAQLLGRDIGKGLCAHVENLIKNGAYVENFHDVLDNYFAKKYENISPKDDAHPGHISKKNFLEDQMECLLALFERLDFDSLEDFQGKIKELFKVDEVQQNAVTLCSIHKAKGAEADTVFILGLKSLPWKIGYKKDDKKNKELIEEAQRQEDNLYYVAVTRAKKAIFYTHGVER